MKTIQSAWGINKEKLPIIYCKLHLLKRTEAESSVDFSRKSFQFDKYPVDFKDDQIYDESISNIVIDEK